MASNPEGLDAVSAALRDAMKDHPLSGQAFGSMEDYSAHRDELLRGEGTYSRLPAMLSLLRERQAPGFALRGRKSNLCVCRKIL